MKNKLSEKLGLAPAILFVVLLLALIISLPFILPSNESISEKTNEKYNEVFEQSLFDGNNTFLSKPPDIEYTGQDKIFSYRRTGFSEDRTGMWSGGYIPKSFTSKTPDDLGGVLLIDENTSVAATYSSGIKALYINVTVTLFDPYKGEIIDYKSFQSEKDPPRTIRGNQRVNLYPDSKQIRNWVEKTWEEYLNSRD